MSSAEAGRRFSLLNIACRRVGNSLIAGHLSDLMEIILLGKVLAGWHATSFVKLWVDCNYR